ncbi:MAG: MaoC family dehydratase [Candidatus Aminicenantes bacterium]|nr:MaoC family dehydratase [Candidatus Aminicenantes bacterium]
MEKELIETLEKLKNKEIGLTAWFTITQDRVNCFAECTEDKQWIHVDEVKAKAGPFGKTVAHGFFILSLLAHFSHQYKINLPGVKMRINYGLNRVRFIEPVTVGTKIRSRGRLIDIDIKSPGRILLTIENTVEIEGKNKPAMVAETVFLLVS